MNRPDNLNETICKVGHSTWEPTFEMDGVILDPELYDYIINLEEENREMKANYNPKDHVKSLQNQLLKLTEENRKLKDRIAGFKDNHSDLRGIADKASRLLNVSEKKYNDLKEGMLTLAKNMSVDSVHFWAQGFYQIEREKADKVFELIKEELNQQKDES